MSEIFISYARSTASQAQAAVEALRASGYVVWLDEQLPAHRAYCDVIEERLRAANAVLVIWSDEAVKSQWVRSEANAARELHKLVQLSVDGVKVPMPFDQIQCANLAGWAGDLQAPGWKKVIASIADLTGGPGVSMVQTVQPTVRKNSICVLPFANMSDDPQQEYFSDGITGDIITDLSKVSALFVIARNTAFTFKAKSVDVSHVVRQLNISHVLEGSVRKSGGRVRITAQLIDGATGGHVWAERYDRELNDIFAIQDEIAHAIVEALKLRLLPQEKASIEQRGTNNLEAYELYLRGTRPAFSPDEWHARVMLLEAASQLAPDYADAWGALAKARAHWRSWQPYNERDEIAQAVSAEAERALALDPNNLSALEAQVRLVPVFGHFSAREALISRMEAITRSNPDPRAWSARTRHLSCVGRIRAAIDAAQRAYEIDPLNPDVWNRRGKTLFDGGRYAEARRTLEDLVSRWPENQYAAANLFFVCINTHDWETIDVLLAPERLARFPLREFEIFNSTLASVVRNPSPESCHRLIDEARKRFEASGFAEFAQLQIAAKVGFSDEAHTIALRAKFGPAGDKRDLMGPSAYWTADLFGGLFPEFRRDPRFVKLCARLGLVDYWLATQQWPDCVDEVAPYYDFKAECAEVASGPPMPLANEAGLLP